jgi:crotonobetainyl-CoA:carnitine CoA-transferase CaiB-like acyl-CoA transferase
MPGPLDGVRVLDLTRLVPGAFATLMLAELGAEVIKIEDPRGGDPMRQLPPRLDGRGLYHLVLDRGKKSIAIDLKAAEGIAALRRLLPSADVVVESFRPATARRLGVSAPQLRGPQPRLIHCAITGYGQSGPYADRAGHDLNYVALSGLLAADRPSVFTTGELPRVFVADIGGGAMHAVTGILAALFARERSGDGATLDIAMHDAALSWLIIPAARELLDDGDRATGELPVFGTHASYNLYRTSDGRLLALGALEQKFWRVFCEALGRADLIDRHDSPPADQAALIGELRALFATRTQADWIETFAAHDCCLTPVNTPAQAMDDPHLAARGVVASVPGGRAIRWPFAPAGQRLALLPPAPAVGADTEEILGRL